MKKKNILFLLTDDQRYNTINALNCKDIKTPNYDRLVKDGIFFENAYIEGGTSAAVCMPSRAMINSGKSLFNLEKSGADIPETDICMCEQFRKCGYETFGTGKWHNGPPAYARSFEKGNSIFFGGMWDHWNVPVYRYDPTGKYDNTINFVINFGASNKVSKMRAQEVKYGEHSSEVMRKSAVDYLDSYSKGERDKPFFLYCAFLAPHDPRTMPEEYMKMYDPEKITLPENYMTEHPFKFGVEDIRDEVLASYPRKEEEIKKHLAEYYGMISHLDTQIGMIIDKLEEIGELENTIIVLTGDNGLALGSHGLMGKQNLYEHSIKVPLIISGNGIPKNEIRSQNVYLFDIYPTLCKLCGIDIPESVEGKSFDTCIENKNAESTRNTMYYAYTDLIRSVKQGDYKLIEYRNFANKTQLFNLKEDKNEICDLSEKEPLKVEELRKTMIELSKEYENDNKFSNKYWSNF